MSFDYLHPNVMMHLYCQGAFPMADEDSGELNWYCPEERTVITMDNYNIPKSLQQFRRQMPFTLRCNTRFEEVVRGCADRSETWISEPLIEAYLRLHALGFAHSVETFEGERLVGGLYGISFKGAFFGELMFSRASQASKVALAFLIEKLHAQQFVLLDVQFPTDHLAMFGTQAVDWETYEHLLMDAYSREVVFA